MKIMHSLQAGVILRLEIELESAQDVLAPRASVEREGQRTQTKQLRLTSIHLDALSPTLYLAMLSL